MKARAALWFAGLVALSAGVWLLGLPVWGGVVVGIIYGVAGADFIAGTRRDPEDH